MQVPWSGWKYRPPAGRRTKAPGFPGRDNVYLTGSGAAVARLAGAGLAGYAIAGIEGGMAGTPGLAAALRGARLVITNTAGRDAFAGQLPAALPVIETRGTQGVTIHYPDAPAELIPALATPAVDATGR